MKAVLINMDQEEKQTLDELMTVFCSAIRYSFNRILEGKRILDIEKDVARKYSLNSRQGKDAVENARQTIESQKQLVKLEYDNFTKKVKAIEKQLEKQLEKPNISEKKRKALLKKLDKRKRKQEYYKNFIDSSTIPPVTFGSKNLFIKRCKGLITKEEWQSARSNRIYSRGDKTKAGNPNLRIVIINNMTYLEISTLEKTKTNRAIKIRIPIYLPQKISKKTGAVNGIDYRSLFLEHLATGQAYQVEIIRKEGKYYCHITFSLEEVDIVHTGHNGIIGIDTNPDGFALTMIDKKGNYKWHKYLKQDELLYARSNRRKNLCGELVKQATEIAKENNCGIAIEDLKFKNDRDLSSKFARIRHQFIYSTLLQMLESSCYKEGIEIVKVKPQYTSKIGLYKYCHQYGMEVHNGAAMVIGRRSYEFKEKVPKILRDKLIEDIDKFNKKSEWAKWSEISKIIKRKVGENPGLWIEQRKDILGIS